MHGSFLYQSCTSFKMALVCVNVCVWKCSTPGKGYVTVYATPNHFLLNKMFKSMYWKNEPMVFHATFLQCKAILGQGHLQRAKPVCTFVNKQSGSHVIDLTGQCPSFSTANTNIRWNDAPTLDKNALLKKNGCCVRGALLSKEQCASWHLKTTDLYIFDELYWRVLISNGRRNLSLSSAATCSVP